MKIIISITIIIVIVYDIDADKLKFIFNNSNKNFIILALLLLPVNIFLQFINLFNDTDNPFIINSEIKSLDTNYRSSKAIIEFNNSFFLFCSNHAFVDNSHKKLYHNSQQKISSKQPGLVNLSFLNVSDFVLDEVYPQKVLNQIYNCIGLGYELSDICILVRKSKEGAAIANFLSDRDINIISSETLALERSPEVCFIVSTLRYLINQHDDQSKLDLLKAIDAIPQLSEEPLSICATVTVACPEASKLATIFWVTTTGLFTS